MISSEVERCQGWITKRTQSWPALVVVSRSNACSDDVRAPVSTLALTAGTCHSGRETHSRHPRVHGGEEAGARGAISRITLAGLGSRPCSPRSEVPSPAPGRLLEGFADIGLARRPEEAPEEHVRRSLAVARVDPRPVRQLVSLFALARFSEHPVDESHRSAAVAAMQAALASVGERKLVTAGGRAS